MARGILEIDKKFRLQCLGNILFSGYITNRLFLNKANTNPTYPLAVYQVVNDDIESTFGDPARFQRIYQVDTYARTTQSTTTLFSKTDALLNHLHKSTFTVTDNGVAHIRALESGQLFNESEFKRVTQRFLLQCGA